MEIIRGIDAYPPDGRPSAVALGAFDGVHLAHQKILATAISGARASRLLALACTFDPHPLAVLQPDRAPIPIMDLSEKLAILETYGLDATVVLPFTQEFSLTAAEEFVEAFLVARLRAREVVVGFNHTFGRGARGTPALLESLGSRHGFRVNVIPPLSLDGTVVSSSVIRDALRAGDVRRASAFLGRPYTIRGRVLRGKGRGRQLGFPTANLKPDRELMLAPGVYAARASWEEEKSSLRSGAAAGESRLPRPDKGAVVNVGVRPTFQEGEYWVEAYLIDFSGDLYDKTLTIAFLERLRPEQKFPDVESLRGQVARDIESAALFLARRTPCT
jgi:riboflavin kinase/FMN adenylyltransferase